MLLWNFHSLGYYCSHDYVSSEQLNNSFVRSWRSELVVGSIIDAKDKSNHWYEAIVIDMRRRERQRRNPRNDGDDDCNQGSTCIISSDRIMLGDHLMLQGRGNG